MGIFFVYILKSSVCLAAFYLFYRLLLSRETFHRFNRFALLGILLLSCLLPLVEVSLKHQTEMHQTMMSLEQWLLLVDMLGKSSQGVVQSQESTVTCIQIALLVYLAGIFFFLFRNLYSLARLMLLLKSTKAESLSKYCATDGKNVLLVHNGEIAPFSWMKYIVISRNDLDENGREILIHELAHIRNRHSWDLLVADVCIFFQWFNPASWLLKQELQNIHEYEADETVINEGVDAKQYQLLLIKKAVGTRLYSMANSFNHSKLKKRITMMLKEKSSPWARLKYLYVLPVAAIAVTAFARPEVSNAVEEITAVKVNDLTAIVETKAVESKKATATNAPVVMPKGRKVPKDTVKQSVSVTVEQSSQQSLNLGKVVKLGGEVEKLPLCIIDGERVALDILKALNPDKIESIQVLKDKEAIKEYGEAGADGVLIVTLKKGDDKMTLSVEGTKADEGKDSKTGNGKTMIVTTSSSTKGGVRTSTSHKLDMSTVDLYVDGVKIDAEGSDLNDIIPADNIESVSVNSKIDNKDNRKGTIYIITKKNKAAEGGNEDKK